MIPLNKQAMLTAFPAFSLTCKAGITKSILGAPKILVEYKNSQVKQPGRKDNENLIKTEVDF